MPFIDMITKPSDKYEPIMLRCINCGSINLSTSLIKVTTGRWWWKKTTDHCPGCNQTEFELYLRYQARKE